MAVAGPAGSESPDDAARRDLRFAEADARIRNEYREYPRERAGAPPNRHRRVRRRLSKTRDVLRREGTLHRLVAFRSASRNGCSASSAPRIVTGGTEPDGNGPTRGRTGALVPSPRGQGTRDHGGGDGGDLVRILMVAEDFPWPSLGGGLIRLGKMVEAVSAMGETDFFSLYDPGRTSPELPSSLNVSRLETVEYPDVLNSQLVALVDAASRHAEGGLHAERTTASPRSQLRGLRGARVRPRVVQHGGHLCLDGTAAAGPHHRRSDGPGRRESASDVVADEEGAL